MSVSITAVPIILIGALVGDMVQAIGEGLHKTKPGSFHIDDNFAETLYSQDFQTKILDKETLLKTLEEHGAINIEEYDNNISCDCEKFHLEFTYNANSPYTLRVSANDEYGVKDLIGDIGNEYEANAQEISYNKIKERLEEKNLEIENEEICEDNTIVLTVNLD